MDYEDRAMSDRKHMAYAKATLGPERAPTPPWESDKVVSPTATPLDDFDHMLATLTLRIDAASSQLGNRADRLFGYRGEAIGHDTAAKPGSLSEALAILNGAVTDLEAQLQRFF